ncbi:uncharacterized protein LOC129765617 [Toxorhynchites rutilus septentrionalis]|uniref:uncharacterized protein LOC129765617 n=1 Tax=Toxorhynchites rutilus septentrionalis TaxID=329112 RepID=UPI0024788233|nr:uncharacterized protein LOC129765617 [Toxorhynchites rutilus septentrionalis]
MIQTINRKLAFSHSSHSLTTHLVRNHREITSSSGMSFQSSACFGEARKLLGSFVLHGQDFEDLKRTNCLNKPFNARTKVQAINILGIALGVPVSTAIQVGAEPRDDECLFAIEDSNKLRKIVDKMRSLCFELIPLAVIYRKNGQQQINPTILIKMTPRYGFCTYLDMSGRIYGSFSLFLSNNKLPMSRLCYPKGGEISFDSDGLIKLDFCEVGVQNEALETADAFMSTLGIIGTVGAMFVTGGMVTPLLWARLGSYAYGACRGISILSDAKEHGLSLDPFESDEARRHWLNLTANLLAFASTGATLASKVSKGSKLIIAAEAVQYATAGVSIVYTYNYWGTLSLRDKIQLSCAVCFALREVISLAFAKDWIRNRQLDGVCSFFSTKTNGSPVHIRRTLQKNDGVLEKALNMIKMIQQHFITVTTDEEFMTITFCGTFEYKTKYILGLVSGELSKFMFMIKGIGKKYAELENDSFTNAASRKITVRLLFSRHVYFSQKKSLYFFMTLGCYGSTGLRQNREIKKKKKKKYAELFAILRRMFGDAPLLKVVSKRGEEMGGNEIAYAESINQLIEVYKLCISICEDKIKLMDTKLVIGAGHHFSLGSAFKIFITIAKTKALSLLRALLDLNPGEIDKLNNFRKNWKDEYIFFEWIITDCQASGDMLERLHFFLQIRDICEGKKLPITKLVIGQAAVEIDGLMFIDQQLFSKTSHPAHIVDPGMIRILKTVEKAPREYLNDLWKKTCLQEEPFIVFLGKMDALEELFRRYPRSISNLVSYTTIMQCSDFLRFYYYTVFAFNRLNDDEKSSDSGTESLVSHFNALKEKAAELSLEGYCPVDSNQSVDEMDEEQLIEAIKTQAKKGALRFGPIENAVLHLEKYPTLRLKSEILKYNRFIAMKKFSHQRVSIIDGKNLILMANAQMQIVVGVVHGKGSYIDNVQLNISDRQFVMP